MSDGIIEGGWLILSDQIWKHPVFHGPPDLFRLWILLLCMAHRKQEPMRLHKEDREVRRGELVTSLAHLADRLGRDGNHRLGEQAYVSPSRQTVARYLESLEDGKLITTVKTRHLGTWIRIVEFERYQDFNNYFKGRGQANGHKRTAKPTLEQSVMELDAPRTDSQTDTNGHKRTSTTPETPETPKDKKPPPMKFNYESGKWNRRPTDEEVRVWHAAYPDIDPIEQFKQAGAWLMANADHPKKRFPAFLNNWMARAQRGWDK